MRSDETMCTSTTRLPLLGGFRGVDIPTSALADVYSSPCKLLIKSATCLCVPDSRPRSRSTDENKKPTLTYAGQSGQILLFPRFSCLIAPASCSIKSALT